MHTLCTLIRYNSSQPFDSIYCHAYFCRATSQMWQHVQRITHGILVHKSTVMLFQATSTCMSFSNCKVLLLGPAC